MDKQEVVDELSNLIQDLRSGENLDTEAMDLIDSILEDLRSEEDATKKEIKKADTERFTSAKQEIIDAIQSIVLNPQIVVSPTPVEVKVPEIIVPEVKIPAINIPKHDAPKVDIKYPEEMKIAKPSWISGLFDMKQIIDKLSDIRKEIGSIEIKLPTNASNPISVRLSDGEKFYRAMGGVISSIGNNFPFQKSDQSTKAALVDDEGNQFVKIVGATEGTVDILPSSAIYNGSKTVPTGTAAAISTSQPIKSVTVKTLRTNTAAVYVGASGVTTLNGFELLADESISLDIDDIAKVYVISGSGSQVVRFIAV